MSPSLVTPNKLASSPKYLALQQCHRRPSNPHDAGSAALAFDFRFDITGAFHIYALLDDESDAAVDSRRKAEMNERGGQRARRAPCGGVFGHAERGV